MNAQDVIAKGKQIEIPGILQGDSPILDLVLFGLGVIAAVIILAAIGFYIQRNTTSKKAVDRYIFGLFLLAVFASGYPIIFNSANADQYNTELTEWKETAAYPYIETQPYVDRELVSIEVTTNNVIPKPSTIHIVKYRNDEQLIETLDLPYRDDTVHRIFYDVPAGEKPFVRMYQLDEDLGHRLDAGEYGLAVHLNEKTGK